MQKSTVVVRLYGKTPKLGTIALRFYLFVQCFCMENAKIRYNRTTVLQIDFAQD